MGKITVKVAYATLGLQKVIELKVDNSISILDAIIQSQILSYFPELQTLDHEQIKSLPIGIYGKRIDINSYQLRDNDRIEIYRRLEQSPNQKRLNRQLKNEKTSS